VRWLAGVGLGNLKSHPEVTVPLPQSPAPLLLPELWHVLLHSPS
jgi:hypothetical protein